MRRTLLACLALLLAASSHGATPPARATRVLVDKSEHRMTVYAGERVIANFKVGLGVAPVGHKRQEGDRRTPEGNYVLDYKNANSAFFRSIHVSYPNAEDRRQARLRGVSPGGDIMVHGQPNDPRLAEAVRAYPYPDWTWGCIALSNADMKALWDMMDVPVPIEIRP